MAIAKVKKIQLIAANKHKEQILELLQNAGALEIKSVNDELQQEQELHKINQSLQKIDLQYANLDFAIKLLSNYGKKRGLLEGPIPLSKKEIQEKGSSFDHAKVVEECYAIEDRIVKATNAISSIKNETALYQIWSKVKIDLANLKGSNNFKILFGIAQTDVMKELQESIWQISHLTDIQIINKENKTNYLQIIFAKELEKEIRQILSKYKFTENELPIGKGSIKKHLEQLQKESNAQQKELKKTEKGLRNLAKDLESLQISQDYLGWQKEKLHESRKIGNTIHSFIVQGWMPNSATEQLQKDLTEITNKFLLTEISPSKNEEPPVIIKNSKFMQPFEAVTTIYGLPLPHEPDPTPFHAFFFILFFALCLTDAGYGIVMTIVMALALKYVNLAPGIRKLVKLLLYGGIVTFVIGTLFGGWFGLTPEQVPTFLTTTNAAGDPLFLLQKFNSIQDPITILILALGLGFFQILFGTFVKLIHGLKHGDKKEALLDTGTWAFMLTGIGFFILAATKVLPTSLTVVGKWWIILAAIILILTQGRDKKSILGKAFSGTLSLYNLIGYLSDILSYSRLLALGLATAIIALAVNVIAALANSLPYIGWLFMIIIFVGGHIFNLLINSLGSFIHSGRLQFVEFFGKFMEGGGNAFKPFSKKTKYTFIKKDS